MEVRVLFGHWEPGEPGGRRNAAPTRGSRHSYCLFPIAYCLFPIAYSVQFQDIGNRKFQDIGKGLCQHIGKTSR